MTDREKVMKGLECCLDCKDDNCPADCPYMEDCFPDGTALTAIYPVLTDAYELLKMQEPKPMLDIADSVLHSAVVGKCPSCGETLLSQEDKPTRFCRYCGQEVTWDA